MSGPGAVRACGLTKPFDDVVALDRIDLNIAAGQIHGIVGPNGTGKTTQLGILPGLSASDSGSLEILGTPAGSGRYVADGDGPNEVNRYFMVHAPNGDVPNPLRQFDGLVDLLAAPSKG